MYKLLYEDEYKERLDSFIDSYKQIFRILYSDTGIVDEDIMYESHVNIAKSMRIEIDEKVYNVLSSDFVGYKILDGQKSIKIFLKRFMLEIFYEEDTIEKIRFIEDIKIHKK